MIEQIPYVNDTGYQILERIAVRDPGLFFEGKLLRERLEEEANEQCKPGESYYDRSIPLDTSLVTLNKIREVGPGTDADNAPIIRQSLSSITPAEASDGLLWTSINCFTLSRYIPIRWGTTTLRQNDLKNTKFVIRHWLWKGTEGRTWNAAARLWWLAELADRASEFSKNSVETLLHTMANNASLYNQFTSRRFLAANAKVVAAVYDVVLDLDGNEHLFGTTYANQLMKALNLRAGTVSFDLFGYDELYEIVEKSLPPKERGATG